MLRVPRPCSLRRWRRKCLTRWPGKGYGPPQHIRAQKAAMIPCVPSQDLIRLRKLNHSPRIWAGNHQDSSDG
jgi:hypothetical protein